MLGVTRLCTPQLLVLLEELLLTDPQTSLTSLTHRAALVPTLANRSAASLGVGALSDEENQYIPSKESALRTVIRRTMTSLRIL
jgi:hypothetical protein